MNEFTVSIYLLFLVAIAGATFSFMWKLMSSTLDDFKKSPTSQSSIHPEMKDVKSGEPLLFFKSDKNEDEDEDGEIIIVRK